MLKTTFLLLVPLMVFAQELQFEASAVLRLAEPMTDAFRVATADLNGDGRPDILIGTANGPVFLLVRENRTFEIGRVLPIPRPCPFPDVAVADIDRDTIPEVVAYCPTAGKVFTYRVFSDGTFESPPNSIETPAVADNARGMAIADFNQDGFLDLALSLDGKVVVMFGNGDATFRAGPELNIAGFFDVARPVALITADFNGDGIPDLATANLVVNDDISVFLGLGKGLFAAETKVLTGSRPHDLVAVDFDRDGKLDLAVASDSGLFLFSGDGRGAFRAGPRVNTGNRPLSVAASDLNGDGLPDFVVGNYYGGTISVILNDGSGAFAESSAVSSIGDVFGIALADLDGDSFPDVIASSYSGNSALFAAGRGNGQFDPPVYFGGYPANSFLIRAADIDADGMVEAAILSQGRRAIHILRHDFQGAATILRDDYPLDGVFADFNGDGIPDLALVTVPEWSPPRQEDMHAAIRVLPGLGDGTFGEDIVTPVERCPASQGYPSLTNRFLPLAAGDFDGDGIQDIAVFNQPVQEIQIYHGNGDGTLTIGQRRPGPMSGSLLSADLNRDGVQDLVLLTPQLTILQGNAGGDMILSSSTEGCPATGTLATGDLDGDGTIDLLLNCGTHISVMFNFGDGTFWTALKTPRSVPLGPLGTLTAVADFDSDGRDDLATISYDSPRPQLLVMRSDGHGGFLDPITVPAVTNPVSMAAADLNQDGAPELVMIDGVDGNISIVQKKLPPALSPESRP